MNDNHQQESIERGIIPDTKDGRAYRIVFEALRKEPGYILPEAFARHVLGRLQVSQSSREVSWLGIGIVTFLVTLAVCIWLTGFRPTVGVFAFLTGYKGLIVFGVAFILGLQWIDRRFIRKSAGLL